MKNKSTGPSVYAYNDFRKFLADYQVARMEQESGFSKSEFSRMLQLPNTRSYFTDIMKGKRVSETFVERFITVIGFNRDEAHYFRTLVRFNQAENLEEREFYFEQLIDLNRTPSRTLDKKMLRYYGKWYNGVIRALLEIDDFTDDYDALAKRLRPPITKNQTKKAVELLLELGLAARDSRGIIRTTDKAIQAPENVREELIRHYQLQCFSLAQKKLVGEPEGISYSFTNTISLSGRGHQRLIRLLEKFQSQVRSLVHKDDEKADRVVQLNVVATHLSK
jgi:uncharacterized protein (TIGR02147 family)